MSSSVCSHDSMYPTSTESLLEQPTGSHRVKYMGAGPHASHDFALETDDRSIDVSLVLPHYRAHNQPYNHRLSMYVGTDCGRSIRVKVCRKFTPTRTTNFRLDVHASSAADVTIWLPSDFKGRIHRSAACKKAAFSAGFTNRIMHNAALTQSRRPSVVSVSEHSVYRFSELYVSDGRAPCAGEKRAAFGLGPCAFPPDADAAEDEVVVHTAGSVTFRMWDVHRGEPEVRCREACKRALGLGWCTKRSNEVAIDWDFLLED